MNWPTLPPPQSGESFGGSVPALSPTGEPVPSLLARQLGSGEQVFWVGRPDVRRFFELSDAFTIPFGLVWLTFVLFWIGSAAAMGAPPFFVAFGVPFLLVGLYLTAGLPVHRHFRRRRTRYAITDRRVVTVVGERSLQEVPLTSIRATAITVAADGTGTLQFDTGSGIPVGGSLARNSSSVGRNSPTPEQGFIAVPDVVSVQALVESLRGGMR